MVKLIFPILIGVIVLGLFTFKRLSLELSYFLIPALAATFFVSTNFLGRRSDPTHSTSKSGLS